MRRPLATREKLAGLLVVLVVVSGAILVLMALLGALLPP